MPIVSSSLEKAAGLSKGYRVIESHIDGLDVNWSYSHPSPSIDAANATLEQHATELVPLLISRDLADLSVWVKDRNDIESFNFTARDITKSEGEDFVLKAFAASEGAEAIKVAWWLESLSETDYTDILDRVGYGQSDQDKIRTRSRDLFSAEPSFYATMGPPNAR